MILPFLALAYVFLCSPILWLAHLFDGLLAMIRRNRNG